MSAAEDLLRTSSGLSRGATRERAHREIRSIVQSLSTYVIGSVPAVTGRTLAIARIIFGSSMLYFWLPLTAPNGYWVPSTAPNILAKIAELGPKHPFLQVLDQTGLLTALSGSPAARFVIYWTVAGLLIAFILGALVRIVYPAFICLFWLAAFLQNEGHVITPLLLALMVTAPVPWGEHWSVDSLVRRLRGRPPQPLVATPFYGYGIWLLGLTIGVTYATAGLSKLVVTEGRWLWETGARNGFLQDLRIAATDWGMFLSNNYLLALGASIMSAFGQAVYVFSCFTRSPVIKHAIGFFIAIPFVVGLVLFMGHFWWAWVILVMMLYVPWKLIDRLVTPGKPVVLSFAGSARLSRHRRWFLAATASMIGLHTFALVAKSEYEPLYSNYQMYADGMLARSENEATFWAKYKKADRHYQIALNVVGEDNSTGSPVSTDLSRYFHIGWNLARFKLWLLDVVLLNPIEILEDVQKGEPIRPDFCAMMQSVAPTYLPDDASAHTVRIARRYMDIVDGVVVWVPITEWVDIDLRAWDCPYRRVQEAAGVGGKTALSATLR